MLGPRVGPGREFVCECDSKEGGIAQSVLLCFRYYIRYVKYKVLMKISAAFYYQNGKTVAYPVNTILVNLLITTYKGRNSWKQSELVWGEIKRHP